MLFQEDKRIMREQTSIVDLLRSLSDLSVERAYDPYRTFEWPESLPDNCLWMSRDLLSIDGTHYMDELSEEELCRLSRWELVNFFSFNVHGIRELMQQVLACIHNTGYEITSEYFHHFLDEENKHMWFFAEFCKRYGGKIYFTQKVQFPTFAEEDIQSFLAFAKILISEQISDFYNVRMMNDDTLPPLVRKINRVHHEDESRHLAMGRRVVASMREELAKKYQPEMLQKIGDYLRRYTEFFVQSFYNPGTYRDAGFSEPYEIRRVLLQHPSRKTFHARALGKTSRFFESQGLFAGEISNVCN